MKKGQAAMEFLMTYGWAILVVLAAVAALAYFGVLSPARFLPERCDFPAGLTCVDKAVISDVGGADTDTISFAIRNNVGSTITIPVDGVTIAGSDCTAISATADPAVTYTPNGGVAQVISGTGEAAVTIVNDALGIVEVICDDDLTAGDRMKADVTVTYTTQESGLSHPSAGTITGKIV